MKKLLIILLLPITICSQNTLSEIDTMRIMMIQQLNEYRASKNIFPLRLDSTLCTYAQNHAMEMFKNNKSGFHSNYDFNYSENVNGCGDGNFPLPINYKVDAYMVSWKNSPGHNKNMLSLISDSVGLGFYKGYAVQIFTSTYLGN